MKKRILSILIALCMVVCLVPTTVFAATQTADSWSGLQSLMNGTGDLSVTLSNDISWGGSSLTVPTGKTVTLDLNGKAIDAQSNGTVIAVNGTLTIKNSGADLAGPIGVGAGPITGNIKNGKASDKEAGGILVASGGKLVMNSGWLTNCVDGSGKTSAAGGIYVSKNAVFEMTGGIITGCVGSDLLCAAGVVNYGTFTMSGNATISGSKTGYNSDGVAICNAGIFDANGGTVQTGQKCVNYATVQNTEKSATVFYCNVLNTGSRAAHIIIPLKTPEQLPAAHLTKRSPPAAPSTTAYSRAPSIIPAWLPEERSTAPRPGYTPSPLIPARLHRYGQTARQRHPIRRPKEAISSMAGLMAERRMISHRMSPKTYT